VRVGIFGGTFNPPHIGHVESAKTAAAALNLDILVVIPVGVPPHKAFPEGSPSADIRLQMSQNTFGVLPKTVVSDIESKNLRPSFTVDTVEVLSQIYHNAELYLLMGTDMYLSIETWKNFKSFLKNITPAVFSRNEDDRQKISAHSAYLRETYNTETETVSNDVIPISSSEIREMLPKRGGVRYITDTNYAYIISNRLYNAQPDWQWLRNKAHAMLEPNRVPHVASCETEAVKLAERWGVDADCAREAAILHDITKIFDVSEHIKTLEDNGITIEPMTKDEEKLLHARSGAVLAKVIFGAPDEVVEAIRWHTTGKAGMSELSKVLYLADYIESTRDFPGVQELRELAYKDINEAMVLGLEMTVSDVESRGIIPDEDTLGAITDLKSKR